jgi:acetyltransferase-like isoleucine patch superfamily enzyme
MVADAFDGGTCTVAEPLPERERMMITERSKSVIPFRPGDAARVGEGCFYLDMIVWLNGDRIEMGDRVAFNHGCYVNGFGGLTVGDRSIFGPYTMIHTANHEMDLGSPIQDQGWTLRPVTVGADCWIGMGVCILPGVTIGDACVIGAGSVVVKDVPDHSVAVGNPATAVRDRREATS